MAWSPPLICAAYPSHEYALNEDTLIEAALCKLRKGDWRRKTPEPVKAGDTVGIVTRADKHQEPVRPVFSVGQTCRANRDKSGAVSCV